MTLDCDDGWSSDETAILIQHLQIWFQEEMHSGEDE